MKDMMDNINKYLLMSILMIFTAMSVNAQEKYDITGTVYNAVTRKPLPNAQVSSRDARKGAITDSTGRFKLSLEKKNARVLVRSNGYFAQEIVLNKQQSLTVYLLPRQMTMQAEGYTSIDGRHETRYKSGTAVTVERKDLNIAVGGLDDGLYGKFAGLRVMSKGGMPGEGAAVHMRGIRSMTGTNMPLVVIDGLPYLPSYDVSPAVKGFSKNIFMPVNMKEVTNVTLLKGADAASYGSLGGNGVLVIETEKATDLETKIQFHTEEGISFITKRLPLLNATQSKAYLGDIGENKYSNPEDLVERLPFLKDDPDDKRNYMYANNTDWQDEIYKPAFLSENILKIKGGDAVAKYMLTLGTQQNAGVVENTHLGKYLARMNTDIVFSQKLTTTVVASLNYSDYKLHEQGMVRETNPMLTALYQAPFMSVFKKSYNINGYIEDVPFYNEIDPELNISNPVAVTNSVEAGSRTYDVVVNLGFDYKITSRLNLSGMAGVYYTYSKDDIFIPGKDRQTVAPVDDTIARNTVRSSVLEGKNYYARVSAMYNQQWNNVHSLNATAGYQLLTNKMEFDMARGVNTPTDFYTTLNQVTYDRSVIGESYQWNWMNTYANVNYNFRDEFLLTGAVSLDGASSYGRNSARWFVFPSVKGAWRIHESDWLKGTEWMSNLTLRGEFGINGNSRFSSRYGKYDYVSEPYKTAVGIVRNGLPNTKLEPEKVFNSNIGVDFAVIGNRVNLGVDLYREHSKNMLIANTQSAYYGFEYRYDNAGEISTKGIEINLSANVLNRGDWNWNVGTTFTHFKSKVLRLGNDERRVVEFSDGAQLLVEVGQSPYLFYGNRAEKIFTSTDEVRRSGYMAQNGSSFMPGDVKFFDRNGDQVINDEDRVVLGDPTPDFYGAFYSHLTYKGWGLMMNFTYSYGNEVYNAVRRTTGSMKDFANQDKSVAHRWMVEGQETDVPRASYGDRTGNSRFSSRWVEDGSYLKLKELTLSYDVNKRAWLFNSLRVYLTGENLLTFTKYLGMDPEFSYSYDAQLFGMDLGKMPLAKNVKVGLILNF